MKKLLFFLLLFPVALFGQEIINLDGSGGGASSSSLAVTTGLSVGGGLHWYSNLNNSDFTVTTIDDGKRAIVTGFAYTIEGKNVIVGSAIVYDSITSGAEIVPVTTVPISGDTITFTDWTSTFAAGDELVLWLGAPPRATDIAQDVTKTSNRNPDYAHYTSIEQIIDETNLDTDSTYAPFYMASYQYFNLHINVSGGVIVTVYVSNNSAAADDDETSDWVDYSNTIFGAANVEDAEGMYFQDTPVMPLKFLVKVVTTDASNAADIFLRRHY